MAKTSMIQREKKRIKLVARDYEKRAKLRAIMKKSIKFAEWISPLQLLQKQTMKQKHY